MFAPHDGRRVSVHPYRRMMAFLMRGRNESAVYFEQRIDVSRTLPWLDQWNARGEGKATVFHLVLHALATVLHERERLNRFTVGRRTFQRTQVLLSFAAKKRLADDAALATVKRAFAPGETFAALVAAVSGEVGAAKSDALSAMDRELNVLLKVPGFLLAFGIGLLKRLYAIGLAPRSLVDTDPMYASAFIANLGSIGLPAAYHHLYEHGNCPLFVTIGKVEQAPAVDGDRVVVRPQLVLRYTFDERVEDGLYCARSLEMLATRIADPATWL